MEWAKNDENLSAEKNLFFEGKTSIRLFLQHSTSKWRHFWCVLFWLDTGCGNGADWRCVGQDLALLAACNHTIQSRGSFGQWAAYLSGGDSYTEYGPMMAREYISVDFLINIPIHSLIMNVCQHNTIKVLEFRLYLWAHFFWSKW